MLSVITFGELAYGAEKSTQRARAVRELNEFISMVSVMSLPIATGESYGAIRAALEAKGETIGHNDLWIAAHAMAAGLILVTNNAREFKRIRGLKIENWVPAPSS